MHSKQCSWKSGERVDANNDRTAARETLGVSHSGASAGLPEQVLVEQVVAGHHKGDDANLLARRRLPEHSTHQQNIDDPRRHRRPWRQEEIGLGAC